MENRVMIFHLGGVCCERCLIRSGFFSPSPAVEEIGAYPLAWTMSTLTTGFAHTIIHIHQYLRKTLAFRFSFFIFFNAFSCIPLFIYSCSMLPPVHFLSCCFKTWGIHKVSCRWSRWPRSWNISTVCANSHCKIFILAVLTMTALLWLFIFALST